MNCRCFSDALCPAHSDGPLTNDAEADAEYRRTRRKIAPASDRGPSLGVADVVPFPGGEAAPSVGRSGSAPQKTTAPGSNPGAA